MSVRLLRVTDLFELGRSADVDAELAALDDEVARTPITWFAWFVLRYKAMRALAAGDLEAAQGHVKQALSLGDATEHPHIRPVYLLQSFVLRLRTHHQGAYPALGASAQFPTGASPAGMSREADLDDLLIIRVPLLRPHVGLLPLGADRVLVFPIHGEVC